MSLRDLGDIKPPIAWLAAGALIAALSGASVLLFTGSKASGDLRRSADEAAGSAGGLLAAPVRAGSGAFGAVSDYFAAGAQNRQLRADLAAALSWRDETLTLRAENARLRALLSVHTAPPLPMIAADTVLDAHGPFSNSRLVDAGADRGVAEGNPVLSDHGLVGRIAGVSAHVSRVLLLTDVDSRTPVMIARTNGRAILTGDGGPNPALSFLRTHDAPQPGDRVLTSGDGGVLPRGLSVGSVVKGVDGVWRVALDSDAEPIDFVRILLFKDFSQIAGGGDLGPPQPPSTATDTPEAAPLASPSNAAAGEAKRKSGGP